MNERIKELAKQAGAEIKTLADGTDYQSLYKEDGTGFDLEKFAKLVEQDCIEKFTKVWYEQGLDIRGADLNKFLVRYAELKDEQTNQ